MFTDTLPSSLSQWIRLLSISTRFVFSRLRERAISELSNNYFIDPVRKIVLAQDFSVSEWRNPAFADLVQREEFIQYEEAKRLGFETSHALYVAREEARKSASSAAHCRCQGGRASTSTLHTNTSPRGPTSSLPSENLNLQPVPTTVDRTLFLEELKAIHERRTAEKKMTRTKAAGIAKLAAAKRLAMEMAREAQEEEREVWTRDREAEAEEIESQAEERESQAEERESQAEATSEPRIGDGGMQGMEAKGDLSAADNGNSTSKFEFDDRTIGTKNSHCRSSWSSGWTTLGGTTLGPDTGFHDSEEIQDEWDDVRADGYEGVDKDDRDCIVLAVQA
jgi:hypothetical protein